MELDFTKRKAELDQQYKELDQKRVAALNLANEIWGEQLKLQGKYKMLEDLETAGKEAEMAKEADKPVGAASAGKKKKK